MLPPSLALTPLLRSTGTPLLDAKPVHSVAGPRLDPGARVGIRWTIGDVSLRGFDALRLSILGARRIFGPNAAYAVCVNSLSLDTARARVAEAAQLVEWHHSHGRIPDFLRARLDERFAEGVAWKFAPMRLFPDRYELALDNDCVLWAMPLAIQRWLDEAPGSLACVLAEDMVRCFGWFAPLCGPEPRNTGIRGLPPDFDLKVALDDVLTRSPGVRIAGEVDEQGLQVAALSRMRPAFVVTTEEVTICSPFPAHVRRLGNCGAHFVGVNMCRPRPESGCDERMLDSIAANWDAFRGDIERAVA
jgi:hypothetical protein